MRVSQFLKSPIGRQPKTTRDHTTYRAARRQAAKVAYRLQKRAARS